MSINKPRLLAVLMFLGLFVSLSVLFLKSGAEGTTAGALGATAATVVPSAETTNVTSLINEDTAVLLALNYARRGSPLGRFDGDPVEVRGILTTLADAAHLVRDVTFSGDEAKPVWLFIFRGRTILFIPQSPQGIGHSEPRIYNQMGVIVDAHTGEQLLQTQYPPDQELGVEALPIVRLPGPNATVDPAPTLPTYPTTAPNPPISLPITVLPEEVHPTPVFLPTNTIVVPTAIPQVPPPTPRWDLPAYPGPLSPTVVQP